MSYESFRLNITVYQSADNGTRWRRWEKALTVPFAPSKGVGVKVGGYFQASTKRDDARPLYGGHIFGLSPDSELIWEDDPRWFRLTDRVITGHATDAAWLHANGFDEIP